MGVCGVRSMGVCGAFGEGFLRVFWSNSNSNSNWGCGDGHVGKDDMMMNVVFQSQLTSCSGRKTPSPLPALISSSLAR